MHSKPKILFLTAWYPNRYCDMDGLFVRKHAEAVSIFSEVCVLYIHFDNKIKKYEIVENKYKRIKEITVYTPLIGRTITRGILFMIAFFKGYRIVKKHFGNPHIVQVNTLTRNGVLAYLLKKFKGIPYFIIEHWSRYMPENFLYKGFLRRKATEIVVKNAEKVMPVSNILKEAMLKQNLKGDYEVVYNVVDDFFYDIFPLNSSPKAKKRLLHISCFGDKTKNISGILDAIKILSKKRDDFELILVGDGVDFQKIKNYARTLRLSNKLVIFTGEQTPEEVAQWMISSDISIIFSNYETACVVIQESLAVGLPTIATPTGIAPDFINESNGHIVDFNDVEQLANKIDYTLDNLDKYNNNEISKQAETFMFRNIGKKIFEMYEKTLNLQD